MAQHPSHASLKYNVFNTAQDGAYRALGWQHSPWCGWLGEWELEQGMRREQLCAPVVQGAEHDSDIAASWCAAACAGLIASVRMHPHKPDMCFTGGWGWCRAGLAQEVLQCVQRGAGGSRAGLTSLTTNGSNPTGIVRCASPQAEQTRRKHFVLLNKFFTRLLTKHRAECPQTSGCGELSFWRKL